MFSMGGIQMESDFRKEDCGKQGSVEPGKAGFHMTELAERLAGPEGDKLKKELLARLDSRLSEIRAATRAGLSREAFRDAETVTRGIEAARTFLEKDESRSLSH